MRDLPLPPLPLAALLLAGSLLAAAPPAAAQQARDAAQPLDFQGRMLLAVADADMVASAYVNGDLGPREGTDALAVIRTEGHPRDWRAMEVAVSNSVAGPPAAVDVTPDGRTAFVVETFGPRPAGDGPQSLRDLPIGATLTVVDLSDPARPEVVERRSLPQRPQSVRVSPDGSLLAISFHPGGAGRETPLMLLPLAQGRPGEAVTPAIPGFDPAGGGNLIDLDWHPTEPILAAIDETGNALRFLQVTPERQIEVIGNVVPLERTPFRVEFTPDGRHVVINGLYWGPDIQGLWSEAPRGAIQTVRMAAETLPDGSIRHAFIDRVMTGVSPEGLAVSPDGRFVASTNLERSYLPYDDARITWYSSVTLARLDPATGDLSLVETVPYDGILPEAAVFDNSSQFLAVVTYDHFDDRRRGGSVDLWRIQTDPLDRERTLLIKTEHSVPVTRGAHSLAIVR